MDVLVCKMGDPSSKHSNHYKSVYKSTSQCTSRTQLIHRLKMKCTLNLNIYTFFIPYMYMYNHIRSSRKTDRSRHMRQ